MEDTDRSIERRFVFLGQRESAVITEMGRRKALRIDKARNHTLGT